MSTGSPTYRPYYWERYTDGEGNWRSGQGPPGADLAALRRGIGRPAGSVPQMWRFYATLRADGRLSAALRAEHIALTLFAVHQQSRGDPIHREGVGLGTAMRALRDSGRFSEEAVDRRFAAAATAASTGQLAVHLRGLVSQLRTVRPGPGLDYSRLCRDLRDWQRPEAAAAVRRRWGAQYFGYRSTSEESSDENPPTTAVQGLVS